MANLPSALEGICARLPKCGEPEAQTRMQQPHTQGIYSGKASHSSWASLFSCVHNGNLHRGTPRSFSQITRLALEGENEDGL